MQLQFKLNILMYNGTVHTRKINAFYTLNIWLRI